MDSSIKVVRDPIDPGFSQGDPVFAFFYIMFFVVIGIISIVAYWKIFVKAGKPGWAAIIPIYNLYVLIEVAKKPGWWIILYFIPLVNIVVSLIVAINLAKVFGKSAIFGVILNWLLQPIGALILGFGGAKYSGSTSSTPQSPAQPTPAAPQTPPAPATPAPPQAG